MRMANRSKRMVKCGDSRLGHGEFDTILSCYVYSFRAAEHLAQIRFASLALAFSRPSGIKISRQQQTGGGGGGAAAPAGANLRGLAPRT
jgi:hypothetical protein